jgi:hypothetical protein
VAVVSNRRRYDTVELVTELKRERRNAILLSAAGVGILLLLLLLYVTAIGDDEVPTVPDEAESYASKEVDRGKEGGEAEGAGEASAGGEAVEPEPEPEPPPPEPVAVVKSSVKLVLTKKGVVWIDGEKLGRVKKKKLELDAGDHEIKAKFGKKIVTTNIRLEPDQAYELKIDARRKKAKLKEL